MEQDANIATAAEVLRFLTGVMRGESSGGQTAMKAAELLGKRFGLFAEPQEELPPPILLDDLGGKEDG